MNEALRPDNNEVNCTVASDPPDKTGRSHYWRWASADSQWRYCTTCGRREYIEPKLKVPDEPTD